MNLVALRSFGWLPLASLLVLACSSTEDPSTGVSECDAACQNATALRGLRETLKLTYNLALQGQKVGEQDHTTRCPKGGTAHITGTASSDPDHGTTTIELLYELDACRYELHLSEPERSYALTSSGSVHQRGVLAGPPETTTALVLESAAISLSGTVFDPPIDFLAEDCALNVTQTGDQLSGQLCDADATVEL